MVKRLPTVMLLLCSLAGAGCTSQAPLEIEVRVGKTAYAIGEKIVVEAVVRNLRDTPLAYMESRTDFFIRPVTRSGEAISDGRRTIPQPDGSEDTIVLTIMTHGVSLDQRFVRLAPGEERVLSKEFVAKRIGFYRADYDISSDTDTEDLPDPNLGVGNFGQPAVKPKTWVKQRKVPNAWIGSVPEKSIVFEVREK